MQIIQLANGMFQSNAFLIISEGEAALIDAGVSPDEINEQLSKYNAILKYIILTHSHADHICFADEIRNQTNAKLCIHNEESDSISDSYKNLSRMIGQPIEIGKPDLLLNDEDKLNVGAEVLTIIHTPGHSPGGICVSVQNHLFTGDLIFKQAWGRTDFPGGSFAILTESVEKIYTRFEDSTIIHSGHGLDTTVGDER